jgi:hypothetical protein
MSLDAKQIERAVLETIIGLHPDHLTPPELVLKVAGVQDPSERETILHAIRDLRRSGLLRCIGDVVVPTHAALYAAALFI